MSASRAGKLAEVFRFFLRLGLTAFGGPGAHIALMERAAVEQGGWVSREHFLDLVGACNLLPGPSSTQVAMALGFARAGWPGLTIAGGCFIVPASLITLGLAWTYVHYGHVPQAQGLLYGTKPVMVAIVVQAIWRLSRLVLRGWVLLLAGVLCFRRSAGGCTADCGAADSGRRGGRGGVWAPAAAGCTGIYGAAGGCNRNGRQRRDLCRCSLCFSNWAWWCLARATCCWRFCSATSSIVCTGSPKRNCWMR